MLWCGGGGGETEKNIFLVTTAAAAGPSGVYHTSIVANYVKDIRDFVAISKQVSS
jgi:predicted RNA-binding protein with RPS1 domain